MIKMVLYLRLVDSSHGEVPGTRLPATQAFSINSLNLLKNEPISATRLTLPAGRLSGKGVMVRLKNQKREENA